MRQRLDLRRVVAYVLIAWLASSAAPGGAEPPAIELFFMAASSDGKAADAALTEIGRSWRDGYAPMILDLARLMRGTRRAPAGAAEPSLAFDDELDRSRQQAGRRDDDLTAAAGNTGSPTRRRLIAFLERQTKKRFGDDLNRWRDWMWAQAYEPHPDYAAFKGLVYEQIDPRMRAFFRPGVRSIIRLDEVDWGGVTVNGIPPLAQPRVISAAEATYLKDSNIVFGIVINGEARAYPKRILGWHEMAIDRLGGVDLTVVYCTLCGTVIPFESRAAGRAFQFGTSGLLYRSNKLMFDEGTSSLWSTFEGVPVVGPLVGSGIRLTSHPSVTTTWKEWRTEHPDTTVLSIDTGYDRDYAEGAAYREYFATDRLMFQVSKRDSRLRHKAEVLVMRLDGGTQSTASIPVAISVDFLRKQPVFGFEAAASRFVVVTTAQGANRVYRLPPEVEFPPQRRGTTLADSSGRSWVVGERALTPADRQGAEAPRVSAQRAFWFGWYAQFPETLLIK